MLSRIRLLEELKRYPVFTLPQLALRTGYPRSYCKLLVHRLIKQGLLFHLERGKYTAHDDPLLVASRIVQPSYLSFWTALSWFGLTTQLPREIYVVAKVRRRPLTFRGTTIRFVYGDPHGFRKMTYKGMEIFVAEKEQLLLDCVRTHLVPLSELEELFPEIDAGNMNELLRCTKNKSLIKRIGFLLEEHNLSTGNLAQRIDRNYVPLILRIKTKGKKHKRWKIIDNRP